MSTPTLGQDAIAALFAAAEEGTLREDGASESRAGAPTIRRVDFRRPRQFSSEIERRLRRIGETFCRSASNRLSAELRTPADLEIINVEQLTWSDAHGQIPSTSMTAVLIAEPIGTRILLSAEQPLLIASIERMLGGSGEHPPAQRRLSDIDMMLAGQLFNVLVEQLSILWNELLGSTLAVDTLVAPQQSAQLAATSEPTLSFTIETKLLGSSMALMLLIPFRAIAPEIERLRTADDLGIGDLDTERLDRGLRQVDMEVRAEVGAVEMPVDQVLSLRRGDLVALNARSSAGVTLYVDDTAIERGRPGRSGARRAVQILGHGEAGA